jgi:hypothetical protein
MAAFDIICCLYCIRQLMFDIWYIALTYRVTRRNRKDRPVCK